MKIEPSFIIYATGSILLFVCSLINWILIYYINKKSKKNDHKKQKIIKRIDELEKKYNTLECTCDFTKELFDITTLMYNTKLGRKDDD